MLQTIHEVIAPIRGGLVTAGLCILGLLLLRLLLRDRPGARRLGLPAALLWLYAGCAALALLAHAYWPAGFSALRILGLLVLALAVILASSLAVFELLLGRRRLQAPKILRDIVVVVAFVVTMLVVLSREGLNLSSILTTSAVLTAVIGFALQDLLSNIIAGVALQIERPFKVGDWLMISDFNEQQGRVLEMNWRSVKFETQHRDVVIVPNNVLTKSAVVNFSQPDELHRRRLTLGLSFDAPPNRVKASIVRAVRGAQGVLAEPEPFALVEGYGESAINYRVHFFINDFALRDRVADDVLTRIWYQLKRDGLEIPFPVRDVNLRTVSPESEAQRHARELDAVVASLQKVPFLEPLTGEERRELAARIRREHYGARETVIEQGAAGESFYLVADGEVEVRVDGRRVTTLGRDSFFGEMSLLTGDPRAATVVTLSDCEFHVIDQVAFRSIIEVHPQLIGEISARLEERRAALEQSRQQTAEEAAATKTDAESLVVRIRRFFRLG